MFLHPEYGKIKFQKILFEMEKPVLFIASFEEVDEKYVGIMVEEFNDPFAEGKKKIYTYYLAGASDNEIRHLERTQGALKEFFETRPVWFLEHRVQGNTTEDNWMKEDHIDKSICQITEKASLSC